MPISTCHHCTRSYWRFRKDHPPRGYCSNECHDDHAAGKGPEREPPPEKIKWQMQAHRAGIHGSPSLVPWYDCLRCEELEEQFAASVEWHSARRAG